MLYVKTTVIVLYVLESRVKTIVTQLQSQRLQTYTIETHHGEILESTEFRTLVPVSEFQENQKRDNGSGHDKHGHQAGQERIH